MCVCVCVCVVRTFKIYPLSNFPVCKTELLTIVSMLYIRFQELIHPITGSWYPSTNVSPFHPPVAPNNNSSTLYVYEFNFLAHVSEIIQYLSFSFWFISLSIMLSRSIYIVTSGGISLFFSIHSCQWTLRLFPCLGCCE